LHDERLTPALLGSHPLHCFGIIAHGAHY
jgi:hypothetical protein